MALLLVYEPATAEKGTMLVARVKNPRLVVDAARAALEEAQARAGVLLGIDGPLAEIELAEVDRLREVLSILIPAQRKPEPEAPQEDETGEGAASALAGA
jgi:hypothetical protein